ncbi:MAG: hypothetical protein ABFS46_04190 [Myxococcota bacterium]
MDTNRLLDAGECGTHLLFEHQAIEEAFAQRVEDLRGIVGARLEEIHAAVEHVVSVPDLPAAQRFVSRLPSEVRHVLVMLYFELLEGRVRAKQPLH